MVALLVERYFVRSVPDKVKGVFLLEATLLQNVVLSEVYLEDEMFLKQY